MYVQVYLSGGEIIQASTLNVITHPGVASIECVASSVWTGTNHLFIQRPAALTFQITAISRLRFFNADLGESSTFLKEVEFAPEKFSYEYWKKAENKIRSVVQKLYQS